MENLELKVINYRVCSARKRFLILHDNPILILKSHFLVDIVDVTSDSRPTVKIPVLPAKIEMQYSESFRKNFAVAKAKL